MGFPREEHRSRCGDCNDGSRRRSWATAGTHRTHRRPPLPLHHSQPRDRNDPVHEPSAEPKKLDRAISGTSRGRACSGETPKVKTRPRCPSGAWVVLARWFCPQAEQRQSRLLDTIRDESIRRETNSGISYERARADLLEKHREELELLNSNRLLHLRLKQIFVGLVAFGSTILTISEIVRRLLA